MASSLAKKLGVYIEPSSLTPEQEERLASDEYYVEATRSIGTGDDSVLVTAPPPQPVYSKSSKGGLKPS